MEAQTLITRPGYSNMFVALKSFTDHEIVAASKDPDKVYEKASKKGIDSPVVIFVPKKGTVCLY